MEGTGDAVTVGTVKGVVEQADAVGDSIHRLRGNGAL
jgi:hypothetical protein